MKLALGVENYAAVDEAFARVTAAVANHGILGTADLLCGRPGGEFD